MTHQNPPTFNFDEGEILLVNKPLDWTSFDVVNKIRFASGIKKVGHAGTLDPKATGLLIICIGRNATRKIDEYQGMDKEYIGTFFLGASTPSFDTEKEPDQFFDINHLTPNSLQAAALALSGSYLQTPPMFSAIKVNGAPLYIKARKGIEIEVKQRPVTIHQFELTGIELPLVHFRIVCSKGTYIRSIASDFGKQLQSGAYLHTLTRTKIGQFALKNAWDLDELVKALNTVKAQNRL